MPVGDNRVTLRRRLPTITTGSRPATLTSRARIVTSLAGVDAGTATGVYASNQRGRTSVTGDKKLGSNALEPCVAMPEITAAPNPLDWGQPVDGLGVLSEQGKWAARAADARKAAESLDRVITLVEPVLNFNYLGEGCAEGASLRNSLLEVVGAEGSWRNALIRQIAQLNELADQCERAAEALSSADADASQEF